MYTLIRSNVKVERTEPNAIGSMADVSTHVAPLPSLGNDDARALNSKVRGRADWFQKRTYPPRGSFDQAQLHSKR